MRVCHNLSASFDDPNLVSCAGLIPVMALAGRAGLHDLAAAHVRVPGSAGANPDVKVAALVAGMVAGADSIDDMDLLRHGGMGRVLMSRCPGSRGHDAAAHRLAREGPPGHNVPRAYTQRGSAPPGGSDWASLT